MVNAASFVVVLVVLAFVPKPEMTSSLPPERVIGAMGAGVRFVRNARPLHAVLARTAAFMVPGSALWALLPLVAKHHLDMTAVGYGLLLGCLGAGAVAGAWCLPYLRRRATADQVLAAASVGFAISMAVLSMVRIVPLIAAAMVIGGTAWIAATSSLISAAQNAAPDWVRARVLAVALLVLQGSLAAGSAAVCGRPHGHRTAAAAHVGRHGDHLRAFMPSTLTTPAVFWPSPELNTRSTARTCRCW